MILLSVFLGIAFASVDLTCQDRYAGILRSQKIDFIASPGKIRLPLTNQQVTDSFELTRNAWLKSGHLGKLRRALRQIAADPLFVDDYATELQESKKLTMLLRSQYQLLAENGEAPKEILDFLQNISKLTSRLDGQAGKRETGKIARELEEKLGIAEKSVSEHEFRPASLMNLRDKLDRIRNSIGEVTGETLPTPKRLHEARRAVETLLTYYQSRAALDPAEENHGALQFLLGLQDRLQKTHGNFVAQARAGDYDFEHQRFFLNPGLKRELAQLETALAND